MPIPRVAKRSSRNSAKNTSGGWRLDDGRSVALGSAVVHVGGGAVVTHKDGLLLVLLAFFRYDVAETCAVVTIAQLCLLKLADSFSSCCRRWPFRTLPLEWSLLVFPMLSFLVILKRHHH